MKALIVCMALLASVLTVSAADYTFSANESEDNTIAYWATRQSLTNAQMLQAMCAAGIVPYFQQRTKLDAETAQQAFQQLSPTDQATVCTLLAVVGYSCPTGP